MLTDKLKEIFVKRQGEPNKKKIENLVVFLIILIITIIVINVIWNGDSKKVQEQEIDTDSNKKLASSVNEVQTNSSAISEDETVKNLEEILSKINGVGKVKVMITYSQTSQTIPLYNQDSSEKNTEESDTQGGTRKITETDTKTEIIYKEENGAPFSEFKKIVLDALKKGEVINIKGFGKFFTRETGEKFYISPITKSKRLSENKVKPKFKFSSKLYF